MVKVLFVCMGNICRSPTAEGVFAHLVRKYELHKHVATDSAGTRAYHIGEPPDPRSQQCAKQRGVEIGHLRARRFTTADFEDFDYILAMDSDNYANLVAVCPPEARYKLKMLLEFAPHLKQSDVPDPYYGGELGFERVFDMVETASEGLLDHIRKTHIE